MYSTIKSTGGDKRKTSTKARLLNYISRLAAFSLLANGDERKHFCIFSF
jgi:hypothetical protein